MSENYCKCGCGEKCNKFYKRGHALRGRIPWNYGKKLGCNPAQSQRMKEKCKDKDFCRKLVAPLRTNESLHKISMSLKGRTVWNKGLTKTTSIIIKKAAQKSSIFHRGKGRPNAMKGIKNPIHSLRMKELWQDDGYIKKVHDSWHRKPNKLEQAVNDFIQEKVPNYWKFVGDGKFWITSNGINMNPDFICKNDKKAIEVFGNYWHTPEGAKHRIDMYESVGWRCFPIWEKVFNQDKKTIEENVKRFSEDICGVALYLIGEEQ